MAASTGPVRWDPPLRGGWLRHFRWGEWLPDPVTPLFDSWFLARSEARFIADQAAACGVKAPPPLHVLVNGYYFHSPVGSGTGAVMLGGLLRNPRFSLAFIRHNERPEVAERICAAPHRRAWEQDLLPRYRALVAAWPAGRLAAATVAERIALVDQIADLSGALMWSLSMVGGFAWKAESSLARFFREHLTGSVSGSHQILLGGLVRPAPLPAHAVTSLDWYHPTAGERPLPAPAVDPQVFSQLEQQRRTAEAACLEALARAPVLMARWKTRLALAQDYAVVREEQLATLTLAWPLLRASVLELGAELVRRGIVGEQTDIFFLLRAELDAALARPPGESSALRPRLADRRAAWERHRTLLPPLIVGKLPGFLKTMIESTVSAMRSGREPPDGFPAPLEGMPASPGRATGRARILRDPAEGERLVAGEVLVARATTPAWTPLFARAAAVVTDTGSVLAHASLIAREYGIPAVVATHDATHRLHDGQLITVDGNAGVVELLGGRGGTPHS
jgi:pyruvate,water dikinase